MQKKKKRKEKKRKEKDPTKTWVPLFYKAITYSIVESIMEDCLFLASTSIILHLYFFFVLWMHSGHHMHFSHYSCVFPRFELNMELFYTLLFGNNQIISDKSDMFRVFGRRLILCQLNLAFIFWLVSPIY